VSGLRSLLRAQKSFNGDDLEVAGRMAKVDGLRAVSFGLWIVGHGAEDRRTVARRFVAQSGTIHCGGGPLILLRVARSAA
jgi:hypothetical protein